MRPNAAANSGKHDDESCTAERSVAIRLAPSMLRSDLVTLRRSVSVSVLDARYATTLGVGFSPEEWLPDQRRSIRRVCPRYEAPVDALACASA